MVGAGCVGGNGQDLEEVQWKSQIRVAYAVGMFHTAKVAEMVKFRVVMKYTCTRSANRGSVLWCGY